MDTVVLFALTVFFGFMATEGTVEYILGTPFDKIAALTPFKWLLMYVSLAAGLGLAFYYGLDIVSAVFGVGGVTPVGIGLTGIVMGRGASFVRDVWDKYLLNK